MIDDSQLLRQYVDENSQVAFQKLVERHLDLVFSTALRRTGDAHRAQDISQIVFATLARKAASLKSHPVLVGWLYSATHRISAVAVRTEVRRQLREQQALLMKECHSDRDAALDWSRLRPVLDDAMQCLKHADRSAILLRFFSGRTYSEIGLVLKLSEDGARMRVQRALDKLSGQLARRGITSTASVLGAALVQEAVTAAPSGLVQAVTTSSMTAAAASATGFAKLWISMNATKAAVVAIAAIGIATSLYQTAQVRRAEAKISALIRQREADAKPPVLDSARKSGKGTSKAVAVGSAGSSIAVPFIPPSWPGFPKLETLLRDPSYRKLQMMAGRGAIDSRYASLFKSLNLGADQLAQFKNLLEEKDMAVTDAVWAAHDQGLSPFTSHDEYIQAIEDAVGTVDDQIKGLLGGNSYQQYHQYEVTAPERAVVTQLQQSLSYGQAPLTDDQANQLIQVLQQTTPSSTAPQVRTNGLTGVSNLITLPYNVTDQAIALTQGILSPDQVAALQQIQSQQQAAKQMQRLASADSIRH